MLHWRGPTAWQHVHGELTNIPIGQCLGRGSLGSTICTSPPAGLHSVVIMGLTSSAPPTWCQPRWQPAGFQWVCDDAFQRAG